MGIGAYGQNMGDNGVYGYKRRIHMRRGRVGIRGGVWV